MVSLLNSTRRGGHGEPSEQYQEGVMVSLLNSTRREGHGEPSEQYQEGGSW